MSIQIWDHFTAMGDSQTSFPKIIVTLNPQAFVGEDFRMKKKSITVVNSTTIYTVINLKRWRQQDYVGFIDSTLTQFSSCECKYVTWALRRVLTAIVKPHWFLITTRFCPPKLQSRTLTLWGHRHKQGYPNEIDDCKLHFPWTTLTLPKEVLEPYVTRAVPTAFFYNSRFTFRSNFNHNLNKLSSLVIN